jgi:hypothetical protein
MNCRGSLNAAAQCDLLDDDYEQPRIADDNTTSGERSAERGQTFEPTEKLYWRWYKNSIAL